MGTKVFRSFPFWAAFFGALLPGVSIVPKAWAISPISNNVALVAGEGNPGYRDGGFTSAEFDKPTGLAANADGSLLYIADTGNNCIRVIDLGQQDKVSTLCGQSAAGSQNGPLNLATFNKPKGVLYLPGGRLVVNDAGNQLLRLVDLGKGTVSTLAGGGPATVSEGPATQVSFEGTQDMAYLPETDSIFFTQPAYGWVRRLDLKTNKVTFAFHNNPSLPQPAAICQWHGKIYVAGQNKVYLLDWKAKPAPALTLAVSLTASADTLFGSEKSLYALTQDEKNPITRLLPDAEPVTLVTSWGDVIPTPRQLLPSLMGGPIGVISDPADASKFYLANASMNTVTSLRDLFGHEDNWNLRRNSSGLAEPEYPAKKPPRTFRILFCGTSNTSVVAPYLFKGTWNIQSWDDTVRNRDVAPPRQVSLCKRMEMELNALAAVDDQPLHFEVLNLFHNFNDPHPFLWEPMEIPEAVKHDDIDLVVIFQIPVLGMDVSPLVTFFTHPMTPEGLPAVEVDPEYMLRPPLERIPDGDPRQFFELCQKLKLVRIQGKNFNFSEGVFLSPSSMTSS